MNFKAVPMPVNAQLSPYKTAAVVGTNNTVPDILLGGNYYDNNIQMGRYDADYGTILLNKGNDKFIAEKLNGVTVKGQVRCIKPVKLANNKHAFIYARNNDSTLIIEFKNITLNNW